MSESALSTQIEKRIDKRVSAETGLTTTGAMAFNSVEQIMEFSKVMAIASVAVPKHLRDNVGACLAVAIQASEWQMSPFAVANKSYVVNDRIAYEAQLVNAVILRRAPIVGRFKMSYSGEGEFRRCKVSVKLIDGEEVEYESPTMKTIPVKNSPLWKGDPDQQLFYYSSRAMCRRHFPDVLLGVYTVDEMQDMAAGLMPEAAVGRPKAVKATIVESVTVPEPGKTITELAAAEKAKEDNKPESVPAAGASDPEPTPGKPVNKEEPKPNGPSAESLLKTLKEKARKLSMGPGGLLAKLIEHKFLPDDSTLEGLTVDALADVHASWEEFADKIKNPGAAE